MTTDELSIKITRVDEDQAIALSTYEVKMTCPMSSRTQIIFLERIKNICDRELKILIGIKECENEHTNSETRRST